MKTCDVARRKNRSHVLRLQKQVEYVLMIWRKIQFVLIRSDVKCCL